MEKVTLLYAIACPRDHENRVCMFDGKIGIWTFIQKTPALRNSINRPLGTMIMTNLQVTKQSYADTILNNVIPAIREKLPVGVNGSNTVYILNALLSWFLVPGSRYQGTHNNFYRYLVPGTVSCTPSTWYQVPGIEYHDGRVSSHYSRYQVPGTCTCHRYLVPSTLVLLPPVPGTIMTPTLHHPCY